MMAIPKKTVYADGYQINIKVIAGITFVRFSFLKDKVGFGINDDLGGTNYHFTE